MERFVVTYTKVGGGHVIGRITLGKEPVGTINCSLKAATVLMNALGAEEVELPSMFEHSSSKEGWPCKISPRGESFRDLMERWDPHRPDAPPLSHLQAIPPVLASPPGGPGSGDHHHHRITPDSDEPDGGGES